MAITSNLSNFGIGVGVGVSVGKALTVARTAAAMVDWSTGVGVGAARGPQDTRTRRDAPITAIRTIGLASIMNCPHHNMVCSMGIFSWLPLPTLRVREARLRAAPRITQGGLAARLQVAGLQVDQTAISKIEAGRAGTSSAVP